MFMRLLSFSHAHTHACTCTHACRHAIHRYYHNTEELRVGLAPNKSHQLHTTSEQLRAIDRNNRTSTGSRSADNTVDDNCTTGTVSSDRDPIVFTTIVTDYVWDRERMKIMTRNDEKFGETYAEKDRTGDQAVAKANERPFAHRVYK